MARTYKIVETWTDKQGETHRDERNLPVEIHTSRERGNVSSFKFTHGKDHKVAFDALMKAAGATWKPGTLCWWVPNAKVVSVVASLRDDGFAFSGFVAAEDELRKAGLL